MSLSLDCPNFFSPDCVAEIVLRGVGSLDGVFRDDDLGVVVGVVRDLSDVGLPFFLGTGVCSFDGDVSCGSGA